MDDIDRKSVSEDEKRATFFAKLKEKKGSGATYEVLISALLGIECVDDAESVCKLLQNPTSIPPQQSIHSKSLDCVNLTIVAICSKRMSKLSSYYIIICAEGQGSMLLNA